MESNFSANWQLFLNQQLDILHKSPHALGEFKALKTNYQRLDFVISSAQLIDNYLESINFKDDQKNDQLSEDYRKKGNNFYAKKDNQNALDNYNQALLYAPHNSKSVYLAFSNRSAVFFDLEMYERCLDDLSACEHYITQIDTNKFNLVSKIVKRKLKCLIKLNQTEVLSQFKESFIFKLLVSAASGEKQESELSEISKSVDLFARTEFKKSSLLVKNHEESIFKTIISDSLDVQFSSKKGRHCLAKHDIKAGEVIFTEKAYASILLPMASLKYCVFCFKSLKSEPNKGFEYLNIHPCPQCSSVFYCSDHCRTQGENFHKFECGILRTLLHNLGLAHLAYRILDSTSQELILKYSNIQKDGNYETNLMNIDYKNDNNGSNYDQVFNLLTHESSTHEDDLYKYSLTALLLGKQFARVLKNGSTEFLKLVSSLILRHLLQCICNAHAITELKDDPNAQQTFSRDQQRYGTAIYPRVSLLNHSCNSNVISSFKENSNIIVVKASRNIKKCDEIVNSYGPHYIKMTYFERKQALNEQYHFDCDCGECLNQSKLFKERKLTGLKCWYCGGKKVFSTTKWSTSSNGLLLECSQCAKEIELLAYTAKFDSVNSILDSIDTECVNDEYTKKCIKKLEEMVKECRKYLCISDDLVVDFGTEVDSNVKIFYLDFSKLVDLLARLNCNSTNLVYGCSLLEKNTKLLEYLYDANENEVNIELGHEFFKLSELQCVINEFGKALHSINRAISIAECVYSKESALLKEYYQVKNHIKSLYFNK